MTTKRQKQREALLRLFRGTDPEEDRADETLEVAESLDPRRMELLKAWSQNEWLFVTGRDIDGSSILWTKDERDMDHPVKPFPDYPYLKEIFKVFRNEQIIMADKSRQMMLTTSAVLFAATQCAFNFGRIWLLSKNTEAEAAQVLEDKIRFPWTQLPEWVQKEVPITYKPMVKVLFPRTRSYILAVGQNVADTEARGTTASGVIIDEAARQQRFGAILQACLPMATKVIALTTAEIGNPGARLYKTLLESEAT